MTENVPSKTFSQLLWVSAGRVALVGTWFLATLLIGRTLGVVAFGFYIYCQTLIKIVTGCIGDPMDMAVMRRGPLLLKSDRPRALQLVRSAFWIRVAIGLLVLLVALALPGVVSQTLFGNSNCRTLAVLTASGVLGDFLLRSVLGYLQIGEQFGRFMAVDAVWQGGRVFVVLLLVLMHRLSITTTLGLYVAVPYVAFALAWVLLPRDVRMPAPPHRRDLADILNYSKWMVTGLAMAAAYERLDVLLLEHFQGKYELGLYAAALTWAVIPDYINGILQTVLGPKIAPAYAAGKFNQMQKTYLKYAIPSGVAFAILALLIANWVLRLFMSGDFEPAANVYRLLVLGTLFNTVCVPLPEALMNFIAPKRVVLFTALGLIWVVIGGLLFIPRYGAIGAAITILSARVIVGSIIMIQAHKLGLGGKPAGPAGSAELPKQLLMSLEETV